MATPPILFPLFGYEYFAANLPGTPGQISTHTFPDGETLVRIETPVKGRELSFICSLDHPNIKALPLFFAAKTARDLGASKIGLIAPYLAYMRQDKAFHAGEGISSRYFAALISEHFDWLITVDPHLHRLHDLSEIYSIPTYTLHAIDPIADWIINEIDSPVLIGPDLESEQWVSQIARKIDSPYFILNKKRLADDQVMIEFPNVKSFQNHTPVLIDDIISTAATLLMTVKNLNVFGMKPAVCIGIHALFEGNSYEKLLHSGISRIVTCNTVKHPSNAIDLGAVLKASLQEMPCKT